MREIKFRSWDKINKKMEEVDGYNLYISDGRMFEIYEASYAYETYMRKNDVTDKYILMQYTGLKDKNGKEIYEGDIIEFDKWMPNETFVRVIRGEVYWSGKGYWAVRNKDGKFLEMLGRTENPEQIGNIYEHPHLLECEGDGA